MGTVCLRCGDEGWENAFVYCVECLKFAVHRYCLDEIPETVDEFVDWVCDDCEGPSARICLDTRVQTRDTSKLGNIDLSREERKRGKTCELLGKDRLSDDALLKDIVKDQKKKRWFGEMGNEKEHRILGGDKSGGQSLKKWKYFDARDLASSSSKVKRSSDGGDKRRAFEKSYESADGLKKRNFGSSNKVVLQEERIEKGFARPTLRDLVPFLENQRNEISCEVIKHDINKDSVEKIIPSQVQERELATYPTVDNGEEFLEDSENRNPQPIAIPIWSGSFHISNNDRSVDGLVAHLSDRACEKVYATACEFHPTIDFEMLPKSRVWPKSFEKSEPSGESIALYFFASETCVNVFDRLVKDMIVKERALKAVLGDAELLIFTSTELPMQYWRFQRKFYLWGVFRGKQRSANQTPC